jgi:phage repressor protein C with HTH and peptisase S24 domain
MEPLIRDGSLLVAERTQTPHEGIYVLARNELLFVKRIQPREPGVLRVISENPAYGFEDIRLDDPHQNLRILGRVIWIGHSI